MSIQIHQPNPQHLPSPPNPHHPQISSPTPRPSQYQTQTSPPQRPPSRSERLLRNTLLRDELERNPLPTSTPTTPSKPPHRRHSRSHSHIPVKSTSPRAQDHDEPHPEYTLGSFLFRSAISPNSPHRPAYGGDAEAHSGRSSSPSPTRATVLRRSSNSEGSVLRTFGAIPSYAKPDGAALTPHEQVLRARLERVLSAGKGVVRREKEERRRSLESSASGSSASSEGAVVAQRRRRSADKGSNGDNEVRDENGWPWRDASPTSSPTNQVNTRARGHSHSTSASASSQYQNHTQNHPQPHSPRSRSKTEPPTPLPNSTFRTPPRHAHSLPTQKSPANRGSGHARGRGRGGNGTPPLELDSSPDDDDDEDEDRDSNDPNAGPLLTPPPTPPFSARALDPFAPPSPSQHLPHTPRRDLGLGPRTPAHDGTPTKPPFNARTASARCRQMEGYVSFASVEGLGEPPLGLDDDAIGEEDGREGKKKGKGGFGRIWRVWPFVEREEGGVV